MSQMPWPHRPLPQPGPDASTSWTGDAVTPADLTELRRRLRVAVAGGLAPACTDDDDIERLLLAFDELTSNALRHGSPPARAAVTATGNGWVIDVSDAATDRPPMAAGGRDPADGGLGLYLVARLGAAHGWLVNDGRKHVWARLICAAHGPADGVAGRLRGMVTDLTTGLPKRPAFRIAGPLDDLREDMVTNLFAVLHEALTNVAQHARARTVQVDLTVAAGTVTLCVVDDGVGMEGAPRDGGLADLRRRAVWHGGTLSVERAATGGTRLTWAVPQRRSSAAAKRAGLPAGGWVTRGLPDARSA